MTPEIIGTATLHHIDCMEFMRGLPDKAFDLAIVDPPYGIDAGKMKMGKGRDQKWRAGKDWDSAVPGPEYFAELTRVSERQIIWGGNYFALPPTGGFLYWNKDRQKEVSFADGELAWTSFLKVLKEVRLRYDGFIGADDVRIHPTQKPVKLYEMLLTTHAKPGQRILDTHLGSGSSAIAANNLGFEFVGMELDADYFAVACERVKQATAQNALFAPEPVKQVQESLL